MARGVGRRKESVAACRMSDIDIMQGGGRRQSGAEKEREMDESSMCSE